MIDAFRHVDALVDQSIEEEVILLLQIWLVVTVARATIWTLERRVRGGRRGEKVYYSFQEVLSLQFQCSRGSLIGINFSVIFF